ncbi:MAG: hypothetical protein ACF8OB_08600, partial [Phycisphaeraceae bacterium JB051]
MAQPSTRVADVLTFKADDAKAMTIKSGPGVTPSAKFGSTHGSDENVLELSFEISDTVAKNAKWFGLYPNEPLDAQACSQADGLAMSIMAEPAGAWWLQVAIRGTDGHIYKCVLTPQQLAGKMSTRKITFDRFKNKDGQSIPLDKVGKFDITGSVYSNRLLYIKDIYLYANAKRTVDHGAHFHTSSPINNIFEPGKTVTMHFDCPAGLPATDSGLYCEARDYFDQVVFTHTFKAGDLKDKTFTVDYAPQDPGYFQVQAWWVDGNGKKLEDRSCLRTTGSMPDGYGTFAVMPKTIEQNRQRMARVGDDAFLGLHGSHENLDALLGVSWKLKGTRLKWVEPNKPADRPDGYAACVKPMIKKSVPIDPWTKNIVNLGINLNRPKWAISDTPNVAPGIKRWDIYMNFFRDYIQVNKHNAQHMKQRIYDLAWEINLNEPGTGIHKPVYHPEDVVEIYRRARPILDQEDPGAILAGPCCSSPIKNFAWNIPLFEKGLFEFIDAYNCHGYHAPPPEEAKIPQTFDNLCALMKKYNDGKVMDIYITELGYRSMYGSEDRQADHARWHARVAGMLKGERIKAYYPFYSYDYTKVVEGSWGICYNLDPKLKFGPKKVSPKAAVPALAVFADQTEGFLPITRLEPLSDDQWGYVYATPDHKKVMGMLWSVYRQHAFVLPVGDVKQVTVVDIMGRKSTLPAKNGVVKLTLTPSPIYVHGLSPALYPKDQTVSKSLLAEVYPGDQSKVTLPAELKNADIQGVFGDVQVKRHAGQLALKVSGNCPAGLVGVMLKTSNQKPVMRWLAIREPLELVTSKLVVQNGKLTQHVKLHNHAQQSITANVRLLLDQKLQTQQQLTLAGSQIQDL